ncbi:MAG TPA: TIM barrel protein [Candidatus Nanoarchaeia archaeon]|nr:TIM barrel protein [Candidatus Nanoarchaeia archaeon]
MGDLAGKLGIDLSIHCPYFINLLSEEKKKVEASKKRILDSCERGHYLGAKYIVFHAAYYLKLSKEQAYRQTGEAIKDIMHETKKKGWNVILAPETSGKFSQFGDMAEVLSLHKELKCGFCIDFAHLYARNQGKIDYAEIFDKLKGVKHIHSHFSGINYGPKGEKNHIRMTENFFLPLAKEIVKRKVDITLINESPMPFPDAVLMKKIIDKLM